MSILLFDKLIQKIKNLAESVFMAQQQGSMTQIPVRIEEERPQHRRQR